MKLSFTVEGEEVLKREFRRVGETLEDLTPAFKAAQKAFYDAETDQFQSGGAKGRSGKWKPLSKRYEQQKIKKYGTFALLAGVEIASEALYKSLTGNREHSVTHIDKQEAAFGTSLPYAKAQHHGYSPRNLPARPLIDLSDEQLKGIGSVMRKEIVKSVKRTTLVVTGVGDI